MRDIQRKEPIEKQSTGMKRILGIMERLLHQEKSSKHKVYSIHEAESVECIAKGKARSRYEFGSKVSIAVTHKSGLVVAMKALNGNPHDGKTLKETLDEVYEVTVEATEDMVSRMWKYGYLDRSAE